MEKEKALAIAAARAAGDIIRTTYETNYTVEYKRGDNSPVTLADREVQPEDPHHAPGDLS